MDILKLVEALEKTSREIITYEVNCEYSEAINEAVSLLVKQGERIAELEAQARWIPVTERMPQQFVSVLACIPCEHPLPMVKEAYFANGCWATRMAIFSDKDVSHWMPLPEPPKEDTVKP